MPDSDSNKSKIHQRWHSAESLIFEFGNLGLVAIEPGPLPRRDIPFTDYLLFPRPIGEQNSAAAHLWVEARECPIFCIKEDYEAFLEAGFGSHKFNVVSGYREVSVDGGSITFFPAAQERLLGLKGILTELMDAWGLRPKRAFHIKLKTRNHPPILFLAKPLVDSLDAKILCEETPARIVALPGYPDSDWKAVERHFPRPIEKAHEIIEEIKRDPKALSPIEIVAESRS